MKPEETHAERGDRFGTSGKWLSLAVRRLITMVSGLLSWTIAFTLFLIYPALLSGSRSLRLIVSHSGLWRPGPAFKSQKEGRPPAPPE